MGERERDSGALTAELAAAYACAHYFVTIGHREWLFRVGQSSGDIERQLGAASYSFITAWNPAPNAVSVTENMAADLRLQARLKQTGHVHHSALGTNAQGGAVEYGWLVLDMAADASDAMAREFSQAGLLFWQHAEPVRLRMVWPRPDGVADDTCTDWVG